MHRKRLIVALVLVPALYAYVMFLPGDYFLFLLTFFSTIALSEFYAMCRTPGALKYAGLFWGCVLMAVFFMRADLFAEALLLAVITISALRLFMRREPGGSIAEVAVVILGLCYVPGLLTFQLTLARQSPAWIVMLYAGIWAADSMAYYVGKGMGRRKLYEEVSPNKTVEGAVGSVVGGAVGTVLIKFTVLGSVTTPKALLLGLVVGSVSVIGDLVESMFKRDAGIKDSGSIMPGHGGILDKIDSVTFAGPAFYWCGRFLGLMQ